jgi:holo-[acyl-carrier protein] synthase
LTARIGRPIVGTGIDVAPIARVSRFVRDHDGRLHDVFTDRERDFCERGATRRRDARYAAVFAAKEAVMKALGTGWRSDVAFADIETRDPAAPGEAVLRGRARKTADDHGVGRIFISIGSTVDTAIAAAVAAGRDDEAR